MTDGGFLALESFASRRMSLITTCIRNKVCIAHHAERECPRNLGDTGHLSKVVLTHL